MKLYFAYGSNLDREQFARRCPRSRPFGRFTLPDWKLVFRGVADIVKSKGDSVEGALYEITRKCEAALDCYEGFPTLYTKAHFAVTVTSDDGSTVERPVLVYVMRENPIMPPSPPYFETIRRGFYDWQIPDASLFAAANAAAAEADHAAGW